MNSISWRNNFIALEREFEMYQDENKKLKLQIEAYQNLYPQLSSSFLEAMNDIGAYGFQKHGGRKVIDLKNRSEHSTPDRVLPEENTAHARDHALDYLRHTPHDHFGDYKYHLAASAFNMMMEYHFAQLEEEESKKVWDIPVLKKTNIEEITKFHFNDDDGGKDS